MQSKVGRFLCLSLLGEREEFSYGAPPGFRNKFLREPLPWKNDISRVKKWVSTESDELYLRMQLAIEGSKNEIDSGRNFDEPHLVQAIQPIARILQENTPAWWRASAPDVANAAPTAKYSKQMAKDASDRGLIQDTDFLTSEIVLEPELTSAAPMAEVSLMPGAPHMGHNTGISLYYSTVSGWQMPLEWVPGCTSTAPADFLIDPYWVRATGPENIASVPCHLPETGILEIHNAADWVTSVARYPTTVRSSKSRIFDVPASQYHWIVHDIDELAKHYRGIHLSLWGYLSTAYTPFHTPYGLTILSGWPTEGTVLFTK